MLCFSTRVSAASSVTSDQWFLMLSTIAAAIATASISLSMNCGSGTRQFASTRRPMRAPLFAVGAFDQQDILPGGALEIDLSATLRLAIAASRIATNPAFMDIGDVVGEANLAMNLASSDAIAAFGRAPQG